MFVDQFIGLGPGVLSAIGAGTTRISAVVRSDGTTTAATTIVVNVAATSPTARIGHNTDLGVPTDADPSDDFLITRRQYTLSYNPRRVGPNWVSWNLDASYKGSASRCNCFTARTSASCPCVTHPKSLAPKANAHFKVATWRFTVALLEVFTRS